MLLSEGLLAEVKLDAKDMATQAQTRLAIFREVQGGRRIKAYGAPFREDFPAQDDAHWLGKVWVRTQGPAIEARFEPSP